ncbi:MAG: YfcE family phosphodiesterase [Clostridiales bacterium]|nr:YfcE family phosphodiesterase [Clostridiales bacterium]
MRIIAFSDTHGNKNAIQKIIDKNPLVKTYLFLGDGQRDIDYIASRYPNLDFSCVSGNCDFNSFLPNTEIFIYKRHKIIFVHGHNHNVKYTKDNVYNLAVQNYANIVLFGHTHQRYYEYRNGIHILNPGSASSPRDFKPPSYAFLDLLDDVRVVCNHVDL